MLNYVHGQPGAQLPSLGELNFVRGVIAGAVLDVAQWDDEFVSTYIGTLPKGQQRLVRRMATTPSLIPAPPRR
jgi:hypothetical protein